MYAMAKIIIGSYMFRYPLGGMLSWVLQYLLGLKDLGHDIYFVEKFGYPNSCYDPSKEMMSDDCIYGLGVVSKLLARFGLKEKWCFVQNGDIYHGLSKEKINNIFRSADLFIDMGTHGSWAEESETVSLRVLIDGEPAYTQIKWAINASSGIPVPRYERYFTNGKNVGTADNPTPTLGINWSHLFHPVKTELFTCIPSPPDVPFSTIMNWQSHDLIEYNGKIYGQKDIEFEKFLSLPGEVNSRMEVAVSGNFPAERLKKNGWSLKNAAQVTLSFDTFRNYLLASKGEFSVCKNVFVANETGWFSDKSGAYLASGRPVVLQDTGFGKHLPVGEGLFAVNTLNEAKEALLEIENNYDRHSKAAWEIANEYLEARKVMRNFLYELGL
jgi:hypothetical protein